MLDKLFHVLVSVALNGIIALIVTPLLWLVLAIVLFFALIPVSVVSTDAAHFLESLLMEEWMFKIIYAIVFCNLMMDEFNIHNLKRFFWKKRERQVEQVLE